MPNNTTPTLEEVNAAFAKLDVGKHEAAIAAANAATPAALLTQICPIYQAVKKVLQIVVSLPFLPAAVKAGISAFIVAMDLLCPAGN